MRKQDLIHPMTAGDLVVSACVVAIRERGMGAETETSIWECMDARWSDTMDDAFDVDFRDRQTGERQTMTLRRDTPLLFTRITR